MLTGSGNRRADGWSLVLLPYVQRREAFVDPVRTDLPGIWSGPALATQDAGFNALKNSYRGQTRSPMVGVNYMFLSPMVIPTEKMADSSPTNYGVGTSRSLDQADELGGTVFYMDSRYYAMGAERGWWGVNAPGLWPYVANDSGHFLSFWDGTPVSGDWCGDGEPQTPGDQRSTSSAYFDRTRQATATFLDGRAAYMSDVALAAGTNFLTAKPHGHEAGACAVITDKSKYLWNLDDEFYEAFGKAD